MIKIFIYLLSKYPYTISVSYTHLYITLTYYNSNTHKIANTFRKQMCIRDSPSIVEGEKVQSCYNSE